MNAICKTIVFLILPFPFYLHSTETTPYPGIQPRGTTIWKPANARLFKSETGLRVLSILDMPRPVLTIDNVERNGPFVAKVSLRVTNVGSVAIAWIESIDGATPKRRLVRSGKLKKSDHYHELTIKIPLKGKASRFELRTPWGDSTIKSIRFSGGGSENDWVFVDPK